MLPVGQDAKYVVKIEPHNNGPLFVEMNFYIRTARKHMSKQHVCNVDVLYV